MEEKLKQILSDLFDVPPESVDEETAMENVPAWNSLNHLSYVYALEEAFGIKFQPDQIGDLISYRATLELLRKTVSPS